jgi:hypothetical protein
MNAPATAVPVRLLRWIRRTLVLGLLMAALTLLTAVLGCDGDDDPSPVYGVPPDMRGGEDGQLFDVPPPADTAADALSPDMMDAQPRAYYGPVPMDTVGDLPPPLDVIEDGIPEDVQVADQLQTLYGPPPADVVDDAPPPVDTIHEDAVPSADCPPMAYYGPPPCASDQECVDLYGEGWYCDEENSFSDGCGGSITWPMCKSD